MHETRLVFFMKESHRSPAAPQRPESIPPIPTRTPAPSHRFPPRTSCFQRGSCSTTHDNIDRGATNTTADEYKGAPVNANVYHVHTIHQICGTALRHFGFPPLCAGLLCVLALLDRLARGRASDRAERERRREESTQR